MRHTSTPASSFRFVFLAFSLLAVTAGAPAVADEDKVILSTRDFVVTEGDFANYLVERDIDETQAKAVFAKEGMVKNAIENIYVIKALSIKGAMNPAINMDEVDWLVNHYRERLLMNRHLDLEVASRLEGADWDALALDYYVANREEFDTAPQVDVDHILVSTAERSEEEALLLAEELVARLQSGEAFADLAMEYSDDQGSKVNGGKVGAFARGLMVPPFEVAAFALEEEGEISAPILSDFGYHLIRLNRHIASRTQSFENVKKRLIPEIRKSHEQQVRNGLISDIKTGKVDLGLEVNAEVLEALEARYASGTPTSAAARGLSGDD